MSGEGSLLNKLSTTGPFAKNELNFNPYDHPEFSKQIDYPLVN